MRYLLVGNYGIQNAGDEILKEYFLKRFPEVSWSVLSAHPAPEEFPRFPAGFRSFFSFTWLRTLRKLWYSDGMVFGGGSLFTDAESIHAPILWFFHALWAWVLRKPIILSFQGIGPFRTRLGARCAAWVIRRAAFISVRDAASSERVKTLVEKNTEIVQSFDPSILLLDAEIPNIRTNNVITYIPRFSTFSDAKKSIHSTLQTLVQRGIHIVVLSLNSSDPREEAMLRDLVHVLPVTVHCVSSLAEAGALLSGGVVVTERFHGALLALSALLPFVSIIQCEGDKLDQIARRSGCPSRTPASFTAADVLGIDHRAVQASLLPLCAKYREEALGGERALIHFLRGHSELLHHRARGSREVDPRGPVA